MQCDGEDKIFRAWYTLSNQNSVNSFGAKQGFIYLGYHFKHMEKTNQVHEGRNIKRFREMLGIKQEALAYELGEDWSQKKVSQLEARETVEEDMLVQVAAILKVPVEAIKNFDEAKALNIISNTFHKEAFIGTNENFNINPIEHWLKALEENKNLYERLLEAEKSKAALLEKLLQDK